MSAKGMREYGNNIRVNTAISHREASREEKRKKFRKERNSAMNNIFSQYGIPQNMGNREIKRRVNYHNWVHRKLLAHHRIAPTEGSRERQLREEAWTKRKNQYTKFLMNDKVFTENKRKNLVNLSIQLPDNKLALLSVRNPVVVLYIMKLFHLFRKHGRIYELGSFLRELKSFGKYREDAAMIDALKNRIIVLKHPPEQSPNVIKRWMDKYHPIPPHPKGNAAAKTIQKTVRGMRNRTTVKKMKTVAGRTSLNPRTTRGKRK